tara:strand:+ start:171 stop:356 length:186 start_codon:yes stop_codon:yes gene_type:complete
MGRLKEFLIQERMRLEGNYRERDHFEYLAWRRQLEVEEQEYERKEKIRSLSYEQESKKQHR